MTGAVFDTSVLIPLSYATASLDLLACVRPPRSVIPSVVDFEVERQPGRGLVDAALDRGLLERDDLQHIDVMCSFIALTEELDAGEAAVVAVAIHSGGRAITHDKAARKIATRELGAGRVYDLVDILVEAGRSGCCPVETLDGIVAEIRVKEPRTMERAHSGCASLINALNLRPA